MNKLILILSAFALSYSVLADEKPSKSEVIEYFKITNTLNVLEGYSTAYTTILKEGYPNLDQRFYNDPEYLKALEIYNKKLLNECVEIIRNNMSKNDLNEISNFLKSELGQKLLRLNKSTDPLFNEAGTKTNIWLNDEVSKLLNKYGVR